MPKHTRSFAAAAFVIAAWIGVHAQQVTTLPAEVRGELSPGETRTLHVRGEVGELFGGRFEAVAERLPVTVTFHYRNGSIVKGTAYFGAPIDIEFPVPASGDYQIRVTAHGSRASYVWRTTRRTLAQQLEQAEVVDPAGGEASPRIVRLQREVTAGTRGALERFWAEVTQAGGPIIEPADARGDEFLVTFLWRQTYETRNVLVLWPGPAPRDYYMRRVPNTDV